MSAQARRNGPEDRGTAAVRGWELRLASYVELYISLSKLVFTHYAPNTSRAAKSAIIISNCYYYCCVVSCRIRFSQANRRDGVARVGAVSAKCLQLPWVFGACEAALDDDAFLRQRKVPLILLLLYCCCCGTTLPQTTYGLPELPNDAKGATRYNIYIYLVYLKKNMVGIVHIMVGILSIQNLQYAPDRIIDRLWNRCHQSIL